MDHRILYRCRLSILTGIAVLALFIGKTNAAESSISDPAANFKKTAEINANSSDATLIQGLTLLTGEGNATPTSATESAAVSTDGPINISTAEGEPEVDPNNPGEILFPGKVKEVKLGASSVGTLSLTIRWFRPEELGLTAQNGGKVRIERAASPEGPWTPVAADAKGISTEQSGYWFAVSRDRDAAPFYLRTVMVDSFGKEWIDLVPNAVDLAGTLDKRVSETEKKPEFSNVSLEKELPAYNAAESSERSGAVSAWNDSLDETEKRDLAAALEQNRESGSIPPTSVPKTASVTASTASTAPTAQPQPVRRPLTNPGTITLNPLLTRGFGIFSSKNSRVESGYQGVANPGDYPAPSSGPYAGVLNQNGDTSETPPTPKRSIFMSPQQYREEFSGVYSPNGYAAQPSASGALGMNYPTDGGANGTIYSAEGPYNQPNGMPSIIYEDANGNVIDNPFANGQAANMPMVVDGNGQVISGDGMAYNADPYAGMNGSMLSLPTTGEMNAAGPYSDVSYSSDPYGGAYNEQFNGPYTNQETTLGTTANLPGPTQTPLAPNVLPPKPATR